MSKIFENDLDKFKYCTCLHLTMNKENLNTVTQKENKIFSFSNNSVYLLNSTYTFPSLNIGNSTGANQINTSDFNNYFFPSKSQVYSKLRQTLNDINVSSHFSDNQNFPHTQLHEINLNLNLIMCSSFFEEINKPNSNNTISFDEIHVLLEKVSVAVCVLGIIGNIANLIVLIPHYIKNFNGRMERSLYLSLIILAFSDLFFCICVIPQSFVTFDGISKDFISFSLWYFTYGSVIITLFAMTGTWLTVMMAFARFMAVTYPFKARTLIGLTVTKRMILAIFIGCCIFSIPKLLSHNIESLSCNDPNIHTIYFRWPITGVISTNITILDKIYFWLYLVIEIISPLVCLLYSNIFLIKTLKNTRKTLQVFRSNESSSYINNDKIVTKERDNQYNPITVTLIAIVLMYVILVSPSEIAMFVRRCFIDNTNANDDIYNLIVSISNFLQAINFSSNFIVYYAINASFRRELIKCFCHQQKDSKSSHRTNTYILEIKKENNLVLHNNVEFNELKKSIECVISNNSKMSLNSVQKKFSNLFEQDLIGKSDHSFTTTNSLPNNHNIFSSKSSMMK